MLIQTMLRLLGARRRVFIIHSMMKTGTTSAGLALKSLGAGKSVHGWDRALHQKYRANIVEANRTLEPFSSMAEVKPKQIIKIYKLLKGLREEVSEYDIFDDTPIGHTILNPLAKKIMFPRAKLIWIDRDIESWIRSMREWQIRHPDVYPNALKEWSSHEYIDRQIASYASERSKIESLSMEYPDDILMMNIKDGWHELCRFLRLPTPDVPYPHFNKGKY